MKAGSTPAPPPTKTTNMNQTMLLLKLRCANRGGFYTAEVLHNGSRIGVRVSNGKTLWELNGDRWPAAALNQYLVKAKIAA